MGHKFSDAEIRRLLPSMRAAFRAIDEAVSPRNPWDISDLQRSMDADYQERLRKWEADAPKRAAAEAAMQRAHERRAAQLGTRPGRMPVLASLWSNEPTPPQVW